VTACFMIRFDHSPRGQEGERRGGGPEIDLCEAIQLAPGGRFCTKTWKAACMRKVCMRKVTNMPHICCRALLPEGAPQLGADVLLACMRHCPKRTGCSAARVRALCVFCVFGRVISLVHSRTETEGKKGGLQNRDSLCFMTTAAGVSKESRLPERRRLWGPRAAVDRGHAIIISV
jgi:hypothetical protein